MQTAQSIYRRFDPPSEKDHQEQTMNLQDEMRMNRYSKQNRLQKKRSVTPNMIGGKQKEKHNQTDNIFGREIKKFKTKKMQKQGSLETQRQENQQDRSPQQAKKGQKQKQFTRPEQIFFDCCEDTFKLQQYTKMVQKSIERMNLDQSKTPKTTNQLDSKLRKLKQISCNCEYFVKEFKQKEYEIRQQEKLMFQKTFQEYVYIFPNQIYEMIIFGGGNSHYDLKRKSDLCVESLNLQVYQLCINKQNPRLQHSINGENYRLLDILAKSLISIEQNGQIQQVNWLLKRLPIIKVQSTRQFQNFKDEISPILQILKSESTEPLFSVHELENPDGYGDPFELSHFLKDNQGKDFFIFQCQEKTINFRIDGKKLKLISKQKNVNPITQKANLVIAYILDNLPAQIKTEFFNHFLSSHTLRGYIEKPKFFSSNKEMQKCQIHFYGVISHGKGGGDKFFKKFMDPVKAKWRFKNYFNLNFSKMNTVFTNLKLENFTPRYQNHVLSMNNHSKYTDGTYHFMTVRLDNQSFGFYLQALQTPEQDFFASIKRLFKTYVQRKRNGQSCQNFCQRFQMKTQNINVQSFSKNDKKYYKDITDFAWNLINVFDSQKRSKSQKWIHDKIFKGFKKLSEQKLKVLEYLLQFDNFTRQEDQSEHQSLLMNLMNYIFKGKYEKDLTNFHSQIDKIVKEIEQKAIPLKKQLQTFQRVNQQTFENKFYRCIQIFKRRFLSLKEEGFSQQIKDKFLQLTINYKQQKGNFQIELTKRQEMQKKQDENRRKNEEELKITKEQKRRENEIVRKYQLKLRNLQQELEKRELQCKDQEAKLAELERNKEQEITEILFSRDQPQDNIEQSEIQQDQQISQQKQPQVQQLDQTLDFNTRESSIISYQQDRGQYQYFNQQKDESILPALSKISRMDSSMSQQGRIKRKRAQTHEVSPVKKQEFYEETTIEQFIKQEIQFGQEFDFLSDFQKEFPEIKID